MSVAKLPFECETRPMVDSDIGFVVSSWVESFHQGSRAGKLQRFALYKLPMRRLVHRLLERSTTIVACDPANPDHLFGWACAERMLERSAIALHYVYVREMRRRCGLGSAIVDHVAKQLGGAVAIYTHETFAGLEIANRAWKRGTLAPADYNPFLAWEEPRSKGSAA